MSKSAVINLTLFSIGYGVLFINYIDLISKGGPFYHIWLICVCFAPFIPVLFVCGWRSWRLVVAMGLFVTLLNDLGYGPMGILLFGRKRDLLEWYGYQLGFDGWKCAWHFDGGFFKLPAWSWLMGLSIILRIAVIAFLLWGWRRTYASSAAAEDELGERH